MSFALRLRALCLTAILASGLLVPFADGLVFHSRPGAVSHHSRIEAPDAVALHGQRCALGVEAPKSLGAPALELPTDFVCSVESDPYPLVTTARPSSPLQRGAPPRAPPRFV